MVKSTENLRTFFDVGGRDISSVASEFYGGGGYKGDYTEKPYSFVGSGVGVSGMPSRIASAFVGKPNLQAEGQNLVSQGTAGNVRFEAEVEGEMSYDGRDEESRLSVQQRNAHAKESRMNSEPNGG
jgi:hypothetical protein